MKTVIQSNLITKQARGQLDVIREIRHLSGVNALFNGLAPTLIRGFLVNCIIFYVNEICHTNLDIYFITKKL